MIVYESFVSKRHPLEIDGDSVKKEKKRKEIDGDGLFLKDVYTFCLVH